jgi:hypothetical protein
MTELFDEVWTEDGCGMHLGPGVLDGNAQVDVFFRYGLCGWYREVGLVERNRVWVAMGEAGQDQQEQMVRGGVRALQAGWQAAAA